MKLIRIANSPRADKKLVASFETDDDRVLNIHFGGRGYNDYPTYYRMDGGTIADSKKNAYLARHSVNENWNDPTSAGALSRWVLWNKRTIRESIEDYRKRFDL